MLNDQTKEVPSKSTTDKEDHNNLDNIIKELPELLVKHAYSKLKSGQELTASEMKVCLEVCKTYSTDSLQKKPDNILDEVPFDTDE
ncbi:hypothetical protein P031_gp51 [Pelagibacter phage HTVC031P]|jgi:hypothetical protein|nr:hypothetical protein P031_gp51 [Pelagibacter phage HTVC031P]|tara:strand:+ start:116 stop:373 length:258 start_codon:yes stop_codon:yes gene_type:complete